MGNCILENERLKVTIRAKSAELISIREKATDTEYLWCGDKKYWGWSSPILFPLVGGLRDKTYTFQGKSYQLNQHGFAREYEFEITEQSTNSVWYRLTDTPEMHERYPFAFCLEIGYVLEKDTVTVRWRVTNTDSKKLYFSIGGHPAFLCPKGGVGKKSDCYLGFETDKDTISYKLVDLSCNLIANEEYPLPLENGLHKLTEDRFDKDALVIEGKQTGMAYLAGSDGKPYVEVRFDVPLFGVWAPMNHEAPFICIEPWYGRSDGVDFYGSWEEREYGNQLEPGEVFDEQYSIRIV